MELNLLQLHIITVTQNKYEIVRKQQDEEEKDSNSMSKLFE